MSSDNNPTWVAVDSLVANEFAVEIDGTTVLGVFRVAGLTSFKLDENQQRVYEPFQIVKMVQRDGNNVFNTWLRESAEGTRPRRRVSVIAIDDGVETRRWTAVNAWIGEVAYSAFDTASSEMVEEIVTIHFESMEESWSASG